MTYLNPSAAEQSYLEVDCPYCGQPAGKWCTRGKDSAAIADPSWRTRVAEIHQARKDAPRPPRRPLEVYQVPRPTPEEFDALVARVEALETRLRGQAAALQAHLVWEHG